ncbi:xanthine dehydrogenase family protein molybdopterin-binding subunit, partial [Rhodopseudomonas sp. B29]|uniref:xanthine dehydrogenase family protein molybdopterin-binding subunit n=1 Tax=Rhodopseudomonas sp. B29 TaxID=95607 RepID=UPI0003B58F7D
MNLPLPLKFVSSNRRVREDRRFVAGHGRYVADITLDGMLHVALVASQYPAAKIAKIDSAAALAMPGVVRVLTGEELVHAVDPLMNGLDTPKVRRFPLAVGQVRYAGEWVVAVVAESRAQAEDAAEKVRVTYEPLPYVIDAEEAATDASPKVHPEHGTNVLLDRTFVWGEVDKHFAESQRHLSFRVKWGRNSTVPIETFGVVARWDAWREMLDVWASIQMPKYPDQIARALRIPANNVRVHQDVDVGGSYGVKRGIKQTVLAAHLSRVLNRPVRLIEDRLENMRAGDAHGPERLFDVEVAFNDDGIVKSMKMRALDNVGAYAGRSPFQLGKPIGAIVGPYKIESVQYRAMAVLSNKTAQEAVRGFGQAPTNYAIETAIDKVAAAVGLDRIEIRRRNFIRHDEFPYLIPSGTTYDSGDYHAVADKVTASADYAALVKERDALRASGLMAGIGIAACLEPSGGNSSFEPLLNEKNTTSTWMDSCRINVDALGFVTVTIHTTSAGQGHETLAATVVGEVLEIDPDLIRVVRPDSLACLPSNSPVGSRMAIMLGGACYHAAEKLKTKLKQIGAHQFGLGADDIVYAQGGVSDPKSDRKLSWAEIVNIGHRQFHNLPEGMNPGLETTHVMQVPTATKLPENGRVQMYPCHSFEFHLVLIAFDPEIAKPEIRKYVIGHDCGVVINPHIVKGMTLGGIAHGIGAALLEEFAYDAEGQLLTQSFMDYLLPSSHEIPKVEIVHHCTPSPFTVSPEGS